MKNNKKRILVKSTLVFMSAMMVVSVLAAGFVQPAFAQKCKFRHTVEPGETVSSIAVLYGIEYTEVAEANNLKEPYVLQVDQVLCIPAGSKPDEVVSDNGTTTTTTGGPSIEALFGLASIYVEVNSLAKSTVYNLQVGNYPGVYTTKIGRFKTDQTGNFEGWFLLPRFYYLQREKAQVCVKNVWTDEVGCSIFDNPYYQTGRFIYEFRGVY